MIDRPNWNFDNSGNALAPAAPSPEQVIREVATQSTPSAASQQLADEAKRGGAGPKRQDWAPTTSDHGNDRIVEGVGYSESLFAKFQREPDGFDANDARLVAAAANLLERPEIPQGFAAAFDGLPVSLQTKAYEALWANPGASLDDLYQKLKSRLTLAETAAARRFMLRLGRRE